MFGAIMEVPFSAVTMSLFGHGIRRHVAKCIIKYYGKRD